MRPEIKLERLDGFRVMRPKDTVTDEQVQEQIDQLRDQRATWTPVEGKPNEGDLVTVSLATADDDGRDPRGAGVPPRARRRPGDRGRSRK